GPVGGTRRVEALGLLDATTEPGDPEAGGRLSRALMARGLVTPRHAPGRITGEVVTTPLAEGLTARLSGFENHGGNTTLGHDAQPLGRVTYGTGNRKLSDAERDAGAPRHEGAGQG